jgi:V/A-type H+-transporting ATPase subunit A
MTTSGTGKLASVGTIRRISGPLVEAENLSPASMSELVALGPKELAGEIIALRHGIVTIQSYETTTGLAPGDPVVARGEPLSVTLGPWLLGGVFDGLLRPLSRADVWLRPGEAGGYGEEQWRFTPDEHVVAGTAVGPGDVLGTVATVGPLDLVVLVPPGVSGTVDRMAAEGTYGATDGLVRIGEVTVAMASRWPIRRPRPSAVRIPASEPLFTGQRVVDLLFPVSKGGAASVPGGFGTGKTVLLQQIAKWCDADVIVYVGCGERGNEMADVISELEELVDPRTGGRLSERTVVVANTSNMPLMAREASVYTGVTVAEYFRDMGFHATVIADSTSRWAEALRELASRTGVLPAEEGYPADLSSSLAAFYERAGQVETLGGRTGSVTVIGAVSPPGGDFTEPVTTQTERFVRCRWTLDHDLAYARHYPAVSWTGSFSRDDAAIGAWHVRAGDPGWARRRSRVSSMLAEADRLAELAELVGVAALPGHERVVMLVGRLLREAVLQQSAMSENDAACGPDKASALADGVLTVADRCQQLVGMGIPAATLEEIDYGPLIRARDELGRDDVDGVGKRVDGVLARLQELAP